MKYGCIRYTNAHIQKYRFRCILFAALDTEALIFFCFASSERVVIVIAHMIATKKKNHRVQRTHIFEIVFINFMLQFIFLAYLNTTAPRKDYSATMQPSNHPS